MTSTTPKLSPLTYGHLAGGARVAQVLGLTATAFLAGNYPSNPNPPGKTLTSSTSTTPALLLAPAPLLAKQWKTQFDADHFVVPALAFTSTPILAWLAYIAPPSTNQRTLYTLAAALLASTVPYSALFILPLTQRLAAKAEELASISLTDAAAARDESVHELVDRWALFNLGRSAIAGVAALAGIWAAV